MAEQLVIGPVTKGLRTDREPFVIDNDSFPTLTNASQWRGRIRRKRGTSLLNRLSRFFNSTLSSYTSTATITLDGSGHQNLITGFSLEANAAIQPATAVIIDTTTSVTITGATQANPCVLSAVNTFSVGQYVYISGIVGMTQLNGNTYQITHATGAAITIAVNSTGFGMYVSGGTAEIAYVDLTGNGSLTPSGTINYATGAILIAAAAGDAVNAIFWYYAALPVMGLEDLNVTATQFPGNLAFDTVYSYNIVTSNPYTIYDVSFYKNPAVNSITMPGYVPKTNPTPVRWNSQNYQQVWTVNYENALWATNGITVPFLTTNIGMQFKPIISATVVTEGPPAKASLYITGHGLVEGDFVFINEVQNITGINFQTGYVITVTDANNVIVEFPDATLGSGTEATITGATQANPCVLTCTNTFTIGQSITILDVVGMTQLNGNTYIVSAGSTTSHITLNVDSTGFGMYVSGGIAVLATGLGGICQYLTSSAFPTKDCMRWYDGDPTNGSITNPVLNGTKGWVNFSPPLSDANFTIESLPPAQYYLVSARMVINFKDRLLFLGPVVQSSAAGPYYLQDTVVYSQNGTPFYTASFTGSEVSSATVFNPLLTPSFIGGGGTTVEGAAPNAYFGDVQGYGGYITAGYDAPMITVAANQDVLVIGFSSRKAKLVYSGNDVVPFNFYIVNSELGDASTFSTIVLDRGIYAVGNRGITITNQVESARIDTDILDSIFQFNLQNNGPQRTTAQRDYINEWVFFTYTSNESTAIYPNQTLIYNYREETWGVFNESYTTYGQLRRQTGDTWATIGNKYPSWSSWNVPWNAGETTLLQPQVMGGNQQGFVMIRETGTSEGTSLYIQGFSGSMITSQDHGLSNGDYILITGCMGTISTQVNGNVFSVFGVTENTFSLNPNIGAGTYIGGGLITRLYVPLIQTKQFPVSWGMGRKTRIGAQMYLFTRTQSAQLELQIYLSQNAASAYNAGVIVPVPGSDNDGLIYTDVLFTSAIPEIVQCFNSSLGTIGNGALTSFTFAYQTLFGFQGNIVAGSLSITVGTVATFTDNGIGGFNVTGTGNSVGSSINYTTGIVVIAFTAAPTSQATTTTFQYQQPNIQNPIASQQAQLWQRMNTSLIGDTIQLGFTLNDAQMRDPSLINQFSEIELHSIILNISPSQLLV